jgi:hypothetical protein
VRSLKAKCALHRLALFALGMLASIAVHAEPTGNGRTELQVAELLAGQTPSRPWRMDAFAPAVDVASGAAGSGVFARLVLRPGSQPAGFRALQDTYGAADAPTAPVRRLPSPGSVDIVQDGNALIPQARIPVVGSHPYWEFVFGVGRTWQEPGEGEWMRAALPFSLMEVNANCLHHGVLTFVFAPAGRISHVAYQVSSETCAYFKADLWGFLQAELLDVTLPDAGRVVEARRTEIGGRLMSTWGVIVDGVHYSGGCPTRAGEYPFCEELVLPSYSVAKSVFGSLGLMRLERRYPGARDQKVVDYVPECAAHGGWSGVTFGDLLDMSSGHWTSPAAYADENSGATSKQFFDEPRHAGKIAYACGHSPRREAAGRIFVYRTSDTYVLGTALAAFVRRKMGPQADLLDDVVWPDVWRVAGLSPVADFSRRTRDDVRQPFVGYGLVLLPDDVAKLGQWLNPQSESARDLLDERMWRSALQLDAADRGLAANVDGTLLYNDGFWAARIDDLPGCDVPAFVPYMSGFGGVSIALLPNGVTYYYFSDGNEFRFRRAIYAAARLHPYCRTATASPADAAKDPDS